MCTDTDQHNDDFCADFMDEEDSQYNYSEYIYILLWKFLFPYIGRG
jgi:hypothetical protein